MQCYASLCLTLAHSLSPLTFVTAIVQTTMKTRKVQLFFLLILLVIILVALVTYTDITGIHVTWLSSLTPENKGHTVSAKYDNETMSLYLQRYEGHTVSGKYDNETMSLYLQRYEAPNPRLPNVKINDIECSVGMLSPLLHQIRTTPTPGVTKTGRTITFWPPTTDVSILNAAKGHFASRICDNKDPGPCVDPACNTTFLPPRARLQRLVSTQYNVSSRHLEVLRSLGARVPPADLVFLTAASENHFDESQGVIRELHEKVFPWLTNNTNYTYNLIYYDLGLANNSLALLTKYCRCHVLSFPFQSLPEVFKNLRTYQWKPVIVKAHSPHSKLLMWMDASVRFKSGDVSLIMQRVMADGFFIQHDWWMMPRHVMPVMLQYFHTEACLLAPFYETEANFFVVKNEPLMSQVVLDPWVACAFAPRCVYPGDDWRKLLSCPGDKRGYSVCHRFDQAALGVILVTLFDFKLSHLVVPDNNVYIWRDDKVKYFPNTV